LTRRSFRQCESLKKGRPVAIIGILIEKRLRISGVWRQARDHKRSVPVGRVDGVEVFGNIADDLADHFSGEFRSEVRESGEVRLEVRFVECSVDPFARDRRGSIRRCREDRSDRLGVEVPRIDFVHEVEREVLVHQSREPGSRGDQVVASLAERQSFE